MPHQRQQQRLSALINRFTFKYQLLNENPDTATGALVQLWIPTSTAGGRCLTTQGAPFAVLGWSSDALAMYRNYVSQYQPMCDSISSKTRCPISRVFANLPPDAADDENGTASPTGSETSSSGTEIERCAAAQLAGIHSTLLLAVHDAEDAAQLAPVAVFELAQHEVHADFSGAVSILAEIAQECGFWIPVYDQAHPRSSIDVPLLPQSSDPSSTGLSAAAQGICSSSWLVVDAPPAPGSDEQQRQQQQPHAGRLRRPSVIYEEHLEYDQSRPAVATYLATPGGLVDSSFRHQLLQPVWEAVPGLPPQLHAPRQSLHAQLSLPKSAAQHQELYSGFGSETNIAVVQHNRHKSMPPQLPISGQQHDDMYGGLPHCLGPAVVQQQRHKSMPPQLPHHVHWEDLQQQQQQQQQPVQQRMQWDMLQQQQQFWEDSSNTRLPIWQQQQQQQQQYGGEQIHSAGVLPYVRQDSRGTSMPLPTLTRLTSNASSNDRVRAIVTVGGTFRQTRTAGGWEYVGGVQKVVSLPRSANHDQVIELLTSKVLPDGGACGDGQIHVKYALPGAVGSFIELACDDDILNMYEELDDYNATTTGAPMRLQLYIETSTASSRGSGGSDSSSRLTAGFRSPWSGLMQLQPSTPTTEQSVSAPGLAYAAAQLSLQRRTSSSGMANTISGAGSGSSASGVQTMMMNAFCRPNLKSAPMPDPMALRLPNLAAGNAAWSGAHALAAATACDDAAQSDQLTSDHLIACMNMANHGLVLGAGRGESEPNLAMVQMAAAVAEDRPGPEPITGSFSIGGRIGASGSISLKQQLQQQKQEEREQQPQQRLCQRSVSMPGQGRRDPQMQELLDQLKVQVEVIMPSELHVVRFIGGGAFGEVYLAKWHGTEVAVKCLSPSLLTPSCSRTSSSSSSSAHNEAAAELMREASILAQMRHPNIVSVFGVVLPARGTGNNPTHESDEDGETYGACSSGAATSVSARHSSHVAGPAVVFEYMAAGSLQSAIRSGAEWLKSSMAKTKVMLDTARGLGYLHSKSMVHFDLKSANLLFTIKDRTPTVKVADFGLSKQRHQTYVTGVDSMRGTLPWIAPEIIKNPANVTEAADIYSYGVIMWELWTGKEPFEGVHLHALLHQLTSQGSLSLPVPGSTEWGDEPVPAEPAPGWCALMLRCWSADPAARPTSKQLTGELENIMAALRKSKK